MFIIKTGNKLISPILSKNIKDGLPTSPRHLENEKETLEAGT